jgi:hypothetical protein
MDDFSSVELKNKGRVNHMEVSTEPANQIHAIFKRQPEISRCPGNARGSAQDIIFIVINRDILVDERFV